LRLPVTTSEGPVTLQCVARHNRSGHDHPGAGDSLNGFAGSPGLVEGAARVILHAEQLGQLEPGDILVAPTTSPSWTPVFGMIAAAVLDTGGIMSHAAIIAREYGLPAVVGTGTATKRIRTGDRLRVDGGNGRVTILQEAKIR
jgi:pyruvate,water dikinase